MKTIIPLIICIAFYVYGHNEYNRHTIDDTLILLRHKEIEITSRIERLSVDLTVAEKNWKNARSKTSALLMSGDTSAVTNSKASAYREHLKALRIELENAKLMKNFYQRYSYLRKLYLNNSNDTLNRTEFWQLIADSASLYKDKISSECQWSDERIRENSIELQALNMNMSNMKEILSFDDLKWLKYRIKYLQKQIDIDSLLLTFGNNEMYPLFSRYYSIAKDSLKNVAVGQRIKDTISKVQSIWHFEVRNVDGKSITLGKIIIALCVILFGIKFAQIISKLASRIISKRISVDIGIIDAGQKLFFYVFSFFFALYALYILQVPLTAFTLAGGALALGIGFGSQNILNNFISGIILLIEHPVKTGDFIEVETSLGKVETIGLRSVRIRTSNNEHLVIPNSYMLEKPVVNWTLSDKIIRLELEVGVVYGSPVHDVEKILLVAASSNERILKHPEPLVTFSDFGDNSLLFHLLCWTKIVNIIDKKTILSQLRFKINDLFDQAGITIAFPQRDIHIDNKNPLRLILEKQKQQKKKA